MRIWLAIVIGTVLSVGTLWFTTLPLGIPGEWTWERLPTEPDSVWNLFGGTVAAALLIAFILRGWRRFDEAGCARSKIEIAAWLTGLVVFGFVWLWIVQEAAPIKNRLGKSAFVLYYASSSGYFTRVRYEQPRPLEFLAGYEELMRQGDVLHTGTHPPGLFLVFHALVVVCESSPRLSSLLDATQSSSFHEACDVIAANNLKRRAPRMMLPLDRRVLWLATLLVMFSASLTVVPLYGLLRRSVSKPTAWVCASLWTAIPSVAVFIPKSDALFPLIGLAILWLWLSAWDRRSIPFAFLAGIVTWCALLCSLAFLPVMLAAGILTFGLTWVRMISDGVPRTTDIPAEPLSSPFGARAWGCLAAAGLGFALPTIGLWWFAHVNLLNVWWLNYQNHAGFYQQYPRTYWKWLLYNPLELTFAAGWPVALLAFVAFWNVARRLTRTTKTPMKQEVVIVAGSIAFVWGLLWLTGKNSGEAGRLWLLFLPWLIWVASSAIESLIPEGERIELRQRRVIALLAIQFAVCLLTVAKVGGFHHDAG